MHIVIRLCTYIVRVRITNHLHNHEYIAHHYVVASYILNFKVLAYTF